MVPEGRKVKWTNLEGSSFTDAVDKLCRMDPTLINTVIFVSDSDPLGEQLLDSI